MLCKQSDESKSDYASFKQNKYTPSQGILPEINRHL